MSDQTFLSKFDAAVLIGLVAGILYLWGYLYWAEYYNATGLPYSVGQLSFERLVMAGSWFLWLFSLRLAIVIIVAAVVYFLFRLFFAKLEIIHPSFQFTKFVKQIKVFKSIYFGRFFKYCFSIILICFIFDFSINYITADALRDVAARVEIPHTETTLTIKGQGPFTVSGISEFDLFEQRNGMIYLLTPKPKDSGRKLIVVPESQIESMTIQRLESLRANLNLKCNNIEDFVWRFVAQAFGLRAIVELDELADLLCWNDGEE